MQTLLTILSILSGLLGVVIGSVLSPWYAHKIEKIKVKMSLRPNLVEAVYTFFNLRRSVIVLVNEHNYIMQCAQLHLDKLQDNLTPQERERTEKLYNILMGAKENIPLITRQFDELMTIEAKILGLLNQISLYYNQQIADELTLLLKPHIDKSNQPSELFKYRKMDAEQISALYGKISDIAHQEADQLNGVSDKIILAITRLLKY